MMENNKIELINIDTSPKPFICPVCEGKGLLLQGFYPNKTLNDDGSFSICRTCKSTGIVWEDK